MTDDKPRRPRGFAAMSAERRREIAMLGGKAVPAEKRSFSRNKELAATAGRAGGLKVSPDNRAFARSSEAARLAGQKGGLATRKARRSQEGAKST